MFSDFILQWYLTANQRNMPWRGIKNPYKIWLSEIILQQTRVEQGLPYYELFSKKYKTIEQLANASDDDVFKLWQGLGYYNRCRNMLSTARYITNELQGRFPNEYEDILKLKGIGAYTAAAIASFAFEKPHAVVDGNVVRVLSRYFGLFEDFSTGKGKKFMHQFAQEQLPKTKSSVYNQAIMDFGSQVCKPLSPSCHQCPLIATCYAYRNKKIGDLPIKKKRLALKERHFNYFIITDKKSLLIQKRMKKDIWQHLYEFHLIEGGKKNALNEMKRKFNSISQLASLQQTLSHQKIEATFFYIETTHLKKWAKSLSMEQIAIENIHTIAFPRIISLFLENNFKGNSR
ncbi:MAG: A/G-specific adenine glycosylase [Chitinophagaceae bacterium]